MNDKGILAWDADIVPWNTITVQVEIDIDIDIIDTASIDAGEDCAYTTKLTLASTKSKTYTFSREAWTPEASATANKWQHCGGIDYVGDGGAPPFFRGCYTAPIQVQPPHSFTSGPVSISFTDRTEAWDADWGYAHVRVGADPGGLCDPIPADDTGTASGYLKLDLDLTVDPADKLPIWTATITHVNGSGTPIGTPDPYATTTAYAVPTGPVTIGLLPADEGLSLMQITGPEIRLTDWKTGASAIDFGGTVTLTQTLEGAYPEFPNPPWERPGAPASNWWTVTSYTREATITITCSQV